MNRFSAPWRPGLLAVLGLAGGAALGCGAEQQTKAPVDVTRAPPGRIRGVVKFHGSLPAPRSEPITKDTEICGRAVSLTRLTVGKNNGVKQAFVYLDGVPASEDLRPRASVTMDQSRCEYGPRVRAVTAGTQLDIINSDPILHNVHARQMTDRGVETLFNIAQPILGQRTSVEPPLTRPGVVALTCEAGHPWMFAYILVASHPYVSVTNDDGEFVIADVPAGTYPIHGMRGCG